MRPVRPSARVTWSEEWSHDRRPVRTVHAGVTANEAAGAPFATTASGSRSQERGDCERHHEYPVKASRETS